MSRVDSPEVPDDETARLEALGYTSEFKREMSMWANFSLGFTYLSPVVATYTLFGIAIALGGPPMIWWLVIVGVGQFLVALVFGEVVSQYPVAGGVYPWARRLWGRRWAWMTGWVYLVALLTTIAGVVYGAGPYLAALLGFEAGVTSTILCAEIMLAIALALNMLGTRVLAMAAMIGFAAELLGAHRRRRLAAAHRAPPGPLRPLRHQGRRRGQLPRGVPRGGDHRRLPVLRVRGLRRRRRGGARPDARDPQGDADDHLHRRRRVDPGVPLAAAGRQGLRRHHQRRGHRPGDDDPQRRLRRPPARSSCCSW